MNQPQVYRCRLPLLPPSNLPPHPTPLRCHRAPELSSLHQYSNFPLAVYFPYGNVYVSMPLSQFISPFPFPGKWWRPGKPGLLQCMERKESDTTERLNNNDAFLRCVFSLCFSCLKFIGLLRYVVFRRHQIWNFPVISSSIFFFSHQPLIWGLRLQSPADNF